MTTKDKSTIVQNEAGTNLIEIEQTNKQLNKITLLDDLFNKNRLFKARLLQKICKNQKLIGLFLLVFFTIGVFGAVDNLLGGEVISDLIKNLNSKEKPVTVAKPLPTPTGTLQLSKEHVYAGSRMVTTEDYGLMPPNPTPTP